MVFDLITSEVVLEMNENDYGGSIVRLQKRIKREQEETTQRINGKKLDYLKLCQQELKTTNG